MQFMYLRSKGSKKNPGRHPIGMLGVKKQADGAVAVAVITLHSGDRFDRQLGVRWLHTKFNNNQVKVTVPAGQPNGLPLLHTLLPTGFATRLNDYLHHQKVADLLVKDEMEQGTWAKQNRDLIAHVDAELKAEKIRAEHGCAP